MKLTSLVITVLLNLSPGQISYERGIHFFSGDSVPVIKPSELKELRKTKKVYLLDTRTEEEYRVSRISGARFVDYKNFSKSAMKDIPLDATIVLYCSVGYRSGRIGEKLDSHGYTDIFNLYGGIFHWKNTGHRVFNDRGETEDVHGYSKFWSRWLKKGNTVL